MALGRSGAIIRLLLQAGLRISLPGRGLVKQVWGEGHILVGAMEDGRR